MIKNAIIAGLLALTVFIGINNMSTTQAANQFKKERDTAIKEAEKLKHENGVYLDATCLKKIDFGRSV